MISRFIRLINLFDKFAAGQSGVPKAVPEAGLFLKSSASGMTFGVAFVAQILLGVGVWMSLSGLFQISLAEGGGNIYIEEGEIKAYLKLAREYEAAQRWREAIEQYQLALKKYPEAVYQVETKKPDHDDPKKQNRYLGIRTYFCQQLLKYPEELVIYREMFNATSEALYLKAFKEKNPDGFARIVNEMFFSSWGDNAANALADMLAERGEIGRAIRLWDMIVNHYPDSELSPAMLLFKIALGAKHLGDEEYYKQVVELLRTVWANKIIHLGSTEKKVIEGLKELDTLRVSFPIQVSEQWSCWGGNRSHNITPDADSKNDIKLWPLTLAISSAPSQYDIEARRYGRPYISPSFPVYPSWYPIVSFNMVYINTATAVKVVDLKTGKRKGAYPVGAKNTNIPRDYLTNKIFSCFAVSRRNVGEERGIIYANLLDPSSRQVRGRSSYPTYRAYLAAFDAVTFKCKWDTRYLNDPLFNDVTMVSPPLFYSDKVYAAVVKLTAGEAEVYLCCLDAVSGILLWKRFICSRQISGRFSPYMMGVSNMPTLAEAKGIICCHTNHGVVATLSHQTGEILWLVKYEEEDSTSVQPHRYYPVSQVSSPVSYPIITNNIVCYALPELNKVGAYDLLTGKKVWENKANNHPSLIGIVDDVLFVQGNDIRAFNIISGKRMPSPPMVHKIIGRGFVTQKYLYLPTRSGLMRFDLETQKVVDYPALEWEDAEDDAGNILVIGGYLLSASQTKLNLFQDLEGHTEEFNKQLQAQPNNIFLIKNYVQRMLNNKKYLEAIRVLTARLDSFIKTRPDAIGEIKNTQKQLSALYIKQGDKAMRTDNLNEAITSYQKALEFTLAETERPTPRMLSGCGRAKILLKLGDCYRRASTGTRMDEPACQSEAAGKAVAAYQQVLRKQTARLPSGTAEYHEIQFFRDNMSGSTSDKDKKDKVLRLFRIKQLLYAELKIAEIIKTHPEAYEAIQQESKQAYRHLSLRKPDELIAFVNTYPYSQPSNEVLLRLAKISAKDPDPYGREIHYLRKLIRNLILTQSVGKILTVVPRLIKAYEKIGAYDSVQHLLTWLMIKFPESQITIDRTKLKVQNYVSQKLGEIKTKLSPDSLSISVDSKLRYKFDKDFPVVPKHFRKSDQQPIGLISSRGMWSRKDVACELARNQSESKLSRYKFYLQVGSNIEAWDLEKQQPLWVIPPCLPASPVGGPAGTAIEKGKNTTGSGLAKIGYTADGNLIIGRFNFIQKVNIKTGKRIWFYQAPGQITSWCVGIERIYLNGTQNKLDLEKPQKRLPYIDFLICLDTQSGEVLWEQDSKEQAVGELILTTDEAVLLRWFKDHLEINDTSSGELIYQDKIFPLKPGFCAHPCAVSLGKIYYLNQNNQLMAYDIYNRLSEDFGAAPSASSSTSHWLSTSDEPTRTRCPSGRLGGFVCITFAKQVILFNRTNQEFILMPKITTLLQVSKFPNQYQIKSIIEDGLVYLWTTGIQKASLDTRRRPSRPSRINCILLCFDPNEGKNEVKWRIPPFEGISLDVVGFTASHIVLKYREKNKGPVKVMVIDKKSGRLIWENVFKSHPSLSDLSADEAGVRVEILNDKLVITAEEGAYIY